MAIIHLHLLAQVSLAQHVIVLRLVFWPLNLPLINYEVLPVELCCKETILANIL